LPCCTWRIFSRTICHSVADLCEYLVHHTSSRNAGVAHTSNGNATLAITLACLDAASDRYSVSFPSGGDANSYAYTAYF
jgi:hypothetical protein